MGEAEAMLSWKGGGGRGGGRWERGSTVSWKGCGVCMKEWIGFWGRGRFSRGERCDSRGWGGITREGRGVDNEGGGMGAGRG